MRNNFLPPPCASMQTIPSDYMRITLASGTYHNRITYLPLCGSRCLMHNSWCFPCNRYLIISCSLSPISRVQPLPRGASGCLSLPRLHPRNHKLWHLDENWPPSAAVAAAPSRWKVECVLEENSLHYVAKCVELLNNRTWHKRAVSKLSSLYLTDGKYGYRSTGSRAGSLLVYWFGEQRDEIRKSLYPCSFSTQFLIEEVITNQMIGYTGCLN